MMLRIVVGKKTLAEIAINFRAKMNSTYAYHHAIFPCSLDLTFLESKPATQQKQTNIDGNLVARSKPRWTAPPQPRSCHCRFWPPGQGWWLITKRVFLFIILILFFYLCRPPGQGWWLRTKRFLPWSFPHESRIFASREDRGIWLWTYDA